MPRIEAQLRCYAPVLAPHRVQGSAEPEHDQSMTELILDLTPKAGWSSPGQLLGCGCNLSITFHSEGSLGPGYVTCPQRTFSCVGLILGLAEFLAVESGFGHEADPDVLRALYRLGLRVGCSSSSPRDPEMRLQHLEVCTPSGLRSRHLLPRRDS